MLQAGEVIAKPEQAAVERPHHFRDGRAHDHAQVVNRQVRLRGGHQAAVQENHGLRHR
jgi:hypothetical protein